MGSSLLRRSSAIVSLAVLAMACSSSAGTPSTASSTTTDTVDTPLSGEVGPTGVAPLPGSLVVEHGSELTVIRPDGSEPIALPGSIDGSQATWSPDGGRLAWSTIRPSGAPAVAVASVGTEPNYIETGFLPFYISWSPSGTHLAVLGNGASGTIEFALIEPEQDAVGTVDGGAPFYFDWSPDSAQIVAHVGGSELRVIDVETGSRIRSVPTTGEFQAPQWTDEGIFYQDSTPSAIRARGLAVQGSTTQRLLVGTIDASDREIARFDGFGAFAATTDRLAYLTGSGLDLWIVETGAAPIKVNDGAILAFQWSPDGTKLLSLEFDRQSEGPVARWVVWADSEVTRFAEFEPTGVWIERYLPFWDQYNRSLSIWSPDGEAFVYSATSGTGPSEIFVQVVTRDAAPVRVAVGDFASWSR